MQEACSICEPSSCSCHDASGWPVIACATKLVYVDKHAEGQFSPRKQLRPHLLWWLAWKDWFGHLSFIESTCPLMVGTSARIGDTWRV